jgi:hypothetical protein
MLREVKGLLMAWDFSPEPAFQKKPEWIGAFVTDDLLPLEPLLPTLPYDTQRKALEPLKGRVREQGLWAAHLDEEPGGTGFGRLPLARMNLLTGRVPFAQRSLATWRPTPARLN